MEEEHDMEVLLNKIETDLKVDLKIISNKNEMAKEATLVIQMKPAFVLIKRDI